MESSTENKHEKIGICQHCGKSMVIGVAYWKKFCGVNCRSSFHQKEKRDQARQERANSGDKNQPVETDI